jgi:diadenosine tetraphosphate (Ap4A) HIT family hydrolase
MSFTKPEFKLNSRLQQDTYEIIDLELSKVLLHRDARCPWLILVPKVSLEVKEVFSLTSEQQVKLWQECSLSERILKKVRPDIIKFNLASIGNVVSQLHIHLIGRNPADELWPEPVWGKSGAIEYKDLSLLKKLQTQFETSS